MAPILAQKDFLLPASFLVFGLGAGGFRFIPCALADALPFALSPPFGSFPSFLCQAGVLAITVYHEAFAWSAYLASVAFAVA